jgi:hypothetical protein
VAQSATNAKTLQKTTGEIKLKFIALRRFAVWAAFFVLALASAVPYAGAIVEGSFMQFSFTDANVVAVGCDPADPAGGFCVRLGTPTF